MRVTHITLIILYWPELSSMPEDHWDVDVRNVNIDVR